MLIRSISNLLRPYPGLHGGLRKLKDRTGYAWRRIFRLLPASLEFGPPRGWFYVVDELRKGHVPGRLILERQPEPQVHPGSLRVIAPLKQDKQLDWPIFWTRHRNARLIGPTLLLADDRMRVGIESAFGSICLEDDPGYRQFRRPPPVRLDGPWTSVVSHWQRGFYHWFFDVLPRLAPLREFPPETRILVPEDLKGFARDTLAWLGLEKRILPTSGQHFIVDDYYFSPPTNMTGIYDPYAVRFLRDSFLKHADAAYQTPRRFFVHRVGVTRGIVNEAEVLQFFRDRGWGIIDTQELTIAQQIQLFSQAEEICTLHGAALTNLTWCPPGCRVLELASNTFRNGVYEGIAEAARVNHQFMLCPGNPDNKATVDLAEMKRRLTR